MIGRRRICLQSGEVKPPLGRYRLYLCFACAAYIHILPLEIGLGRQLYAQFVCASGDTRKAIAPICAGAGFPAHRGAGVGGEGAGIKSQSLFPRRDSRLLIGMRSHPPDSAFIILRFCPKYTRFCWHRSSVGYCFSCAQTPATTAQIEPAPVS